MATISEALATAIQHHQAGQLQAAEQIYRQILAIDPDHIETLHLLGLAASRQGRPEAAVELIRRAIALSGTNAVFHSNLGAVLKDQGKLEEAVACCRRALELKPDHAAAHYNLGSAFQAQGKLKEAIACFRRALELKPDYAEAHNNLGIAYLAQNDLDQAAACFRRTLELRPDFAIALYNLGGILQGQGKLDEAVACLRRAVELQPDFAEAHNGLGNSLWGQGQLKDAFHCFRRAAELKPDYSEAYVNLGNAFLFQGQLDEAVLCCHRALELNPNYALAHNNLGNALLTLGKFDEAVRSYRRAVELKPDDAETHSNLANALQQLRRFDEASAHYAQALELRPDHAIAHYARATLKLLTGDFESGWPEYEWRLKTNEHVRRKFSTPSWDGNPLEKRTILLHAEQCLGDTIQFVRFAALIKKQHPAATVIVECQRSLTKLLAKCPGVDRLIARGDDLPPFDVQASLMSLPGILRTSWETIPAEIPYLFADSALVNQWREKLEPVRGVRIGINWRGRPNTRHRDIPIESFRSLAKLPGVRLISLQKGEASTEIFAADRDGSPFVDLGNDFDTAHGAFVDTAAIMLNLDLVISCDTSIPHLAGALGIPVWLALPFVPDWRWLLDRRDSPWYPTMRLFRQQTPGDWSGVFEEIQVALQERLQRSVGRD